MKPLSLVELLLFHFDSAADRSGAAPINRQLYDVIKGAILNGTLPVGARIPSSRDLASELNLSRNTVLFAYEQLRAEGFTEARSGSGTFIADIEVKVAKGQCEKGRSIQVAATLSARGQHLVSNAGGSALQWGAFKPGMPDVTLFPSKVWTRLLNKYWRRLDPNLMGYSSGAGYGPLRAAIAEHARIHRSVNCEARQVLITGGIHQSLDLIPRLLGDPGDLALSENPGYWGIRSVARSLGLQLSVAPVDADGMRLPERASNVDPKFIVVSPSHQYPLGVVMSLERRRALLDYAADCNAWILEDDYDSEFRYHSRPIPSLQGLDEHGRVIYMGTFSKTMFPGLRIGYLIVPPALVEPFIVGLPELYREGHLATQAALADFMAEGHFAAHVRNMRQVYSERVETLYELMQASFGERVELFGGDAGLHLTIRFRHDIDDVMLADEIGAVGVVVRPLSHYYSGNEKRRSGLVLGIGCIAVESIPKQFSRIVAIIDRAIAGL